MAADMSRIFRRYVERVYRDKALFESLLPKQYVKLTELIGKSNPHVELVSGDKHYFSVEELKTLYDMLPWYLRSFTLLPWVFSYTTSNFTPRYTLLNPDKWSPRILGYVLYSDVSRKVTQLKSTEFERLLSRFKTLIIVILNVELTSGGEEEGIRGYEA